MLPLIVFVFFFFFSPFGRRREEVVHERQRKRVIFFSLHWRKKFTFPQTLPEYNTHNARIKMSNSLTSFIHKQTKGVLSSFSPSEEEEEMTSSRLAKTIRKRSDQFVSQMAPHLDAIETNVSAFVSSTRGERLTKTLELNALIDSDARSSAKGLEKLNEEMRLEMERRVGREASALEALKREMEEVIEAKEKEAKIEEERKEKERKERREKELREAMMFRKE